ncbi:hypothetical protein ACP4OV_025704 [Aristida adscensionis]
MVQLRCPPTNFLDLPWALRLELIGGGLLISGVTMVVTVVAALVAYLYDRRRRGRREKAARGAAEAAAAAAAIAALEARAEAVEKELILHAGAVEEGCAAAEVVARRAAELRRSLSGWWRALDAHAEHFSSPMVFFATGSEVQVPLPPPPVAHRRSRSFSF